MFGVGATELLIVIVWLITGVIGASLAKNKGRSPVIWFLLCAFFWLALLIIILLPPAKEVTGKFRECPSCREFVKWDAIICKHCKSEIML